MNPIVLKDQSAEPTNEIVFSYIGSKKVFWQNLHKKLSAEHNEIHGEWRFYNDGKSWLYRALRKDKVIFWIGVMQDDFVVTFYLSNKAETLIDASDLPDIIKQNFEKNKGEKFRSISIHVNSEQDIENILNLVKIKMKVK